MIVVMIVPKESIEVISQSIGITNLSPDVFPALAAHVEYHVREIMQEAIKCMRHSKRTVLSSEDVNITLTLRNVEPVYEFASKDSLRFKQAYGHQDLYYIDAKDVEFKDVFGKNFVMEAKFFHFLKIVVVGFKPRAESDGLSCI